MDFVTLLLILLGMFGGVFFRAIVKNGTNFDFFIWLKYDLNRLVIGLICSLFVFALQTFAPSAMVYLEGFGLKVAGESAVLVGGSIAVFVLSLKNNNPSK